MKYADVQQAVFSVFATVGWQAEGISTFPESFQDTKGDEYVEVFIVPSGTGASDFSSGNKRASGVVIIDIYTPIGNGPSRAMEIADKLDSYFALKQVMGSVGTVQFGKSTMNQGRPSVKNSALRVQTYNMSFNLF